MERKWIDFEFTRTANQSRIIIRPLMFVNFANFIKYFQSNNLHAIIYSIMEGLVFRFTALFYFYFFLKTSYIMLKIFDCVVIITYSVILNKKWVCTTHFESLGVDVE